MPESLVSIYTAANAEQAHLLASALAEHGIDAQVSNTALQTLLGSVPVGPETLPQVGVAASRAAEAREVALEFERREQQRGRLAEERSTGPRAHQFSLRTLFWLVTFAAIYACIFVATANLPPAAGGQLRAVGLYSLLIVAFFVAAYRKFKRRRMWPDE